MTKPKVGDIAIWGGHVEIVVSVNGDSFTTSGSSGKNGTPIPTSKTFKSSTDDDLKEYSGKFQGFWTPK